MQTLIDMFAPGSGEWNGAGLRAVRSVLLLHAAVRTAARLLAGPEPTSMPFAAQAAVGALMLLAVAGGTLRRFGRGAALLGASLVLVQLVASFPAVADEVYLEFFCLALFGLLDADDPNDGRLLRSALCWMGVLVLFHSGLQKLLYGYYFHGETLLAGLAGRDPLAQSLRWLLAPGEEPVLMRLKLGAQGAGPLRTASTGFILVSNALWAVPLVLSTLIVARRCRALAVPATIAFVVLLSVSAGEIAAGLLLAQLLLLCIPGEWNRRFVWVFVVIYGLAFGYLSVVSAPLWVGRGGA